MLERAITKAIMDAVRPGWRARANRRKSPWHLVKLVLLLIFLGVLWFALFRLMWQVHVLFHSAHAGHLQEFLRGGVRGFPLIASLLLLLPLFLPALGLSLILTNLVCWCVPPARRAFEREAMGDPEMTFRGSTEKLARVTLRYLVPIGIGLSLVGAWMLADLR